MQSIIVDRYGSPFEREAKIAPGHEILAQFEDFQRQWEAGFTNRMNAGHWRYAQGFDINQMLFQFLPILRNRCAYEIENNPNVQGIQETWANDITGDVGPTLQVLSDDDDYNESLEQIFTDWFEMPDINGEMSGIDFLDMGHRSLWDDGSYLWQICDAGPEWDIGCRLHAIAATRLETPPGMEMTVALGIKRNRTGRPLKYFVQDVDESGLFNSWANKYTEIPADQAIHGFKRKKAGQITGVPLLVPSLSSIADLRDFDDQVMDAARAAADSGVLLYSEQAENIAELQPSSERMHRRTQRTLQPGWKPFQLKAEQPAANYLDYRGERLRDFGRPVGMPQMIIRLDSSKHNYSSARFDNQIYRTGITKQRNETGRRSLSPLVDIVAREAELAGLLPPRPDRVRYKFGWPKFPHVDPNKEAEAANTRMEGGLTTLEEEIEANGGSLEGNLARHKRTVRLFKQYGFEAPAYPAVKAPAMIKPKDNDDDDDGWAKKDKEKSASRRTQRRPQRSRRFQLN